MRHYEHEVLRVTDVLILVVMDVSCESVGTKKEVLALLS